MQETRSYLGCTVGGITRWFGKGTMIAFEVADGTTRMMLLLKEAIAWGPAA